MKRLILSVNVTLDGYMAGPDGELDWHFDYWNPEMSAYADAQLQTVDTIVVGRTTYEGMAQYWPGAALDPSIGVKDRLFAERMNALPKIVFSSTLETLAWNNARLATYDVAGELARLRNGPGLDIIMWGGVRLVRHCIEHDLIDEYRIWTAPCMLGGGQRLFPKDIAFRPLQHLESRVFGNGVVLTCFASVTN